MNNGVNAHNLGSRLNLKGQTLNGVPPAVSISMGARKSSFQHLGMIEGVLGDEFFGA